MVILAQAGGAAGRVGSLFKIRLVVAAAQGAALFGLASAATAPLHWPATAPTIFDPLALAAAFIPILVLFGVGQIRPRPLAIWVAIATVIVGGLGWHDAARGRVNPFGGNVSPWPWVELWFALGASLFIAHVLVVDSVIEQRLNPSYTRHFDSAWKQGVQAVLAVVFVGLLWLVLQLGASLFQLVKLDFLRHLIARPWFAWPVSSLALAVAIHVTDVQPALIRGARSMALTLFSWLTPLLALILIGFLGVLPFTSLKPLWHTHFAASLLLGAAAGVVFLINTCYQDGSTWGGASIVKRVAALVGAVELAPLVALVAWALWLRVAEYGWTAQRITAAFTALIAAAHAAGYLAAALKLRPWLKGLELTNFLAAYLIIAIFLAVFSPIADPARLMVAAQVARLKSGAVLPDKFDFVTLKFDGARWGVKALTTMSRHWAGPGSAVVRVDARKALTQKTREELIEPPATADVRLYPLGRTPPALLNEIPISCFDNTYGGGCVGRFMRLSSKSRESLIILDNTSGYVLDKDAQGKWRLTGRLDVCGDFRAALARDVPKLTPHLEPDLILGGKRVALQDPACQAAPAQLVLRPVTPPASSSGRPPHP